jgi:hypothetical protein
VVRRLPHRFSLFFWLAWEPVPVLLLLMLLRKRRVTLLLPYVLCRFAERQFGVWPFERRRIFARRDLLLLMLMVK